MNLSEDYLLNIIFMLLSIIQAVSLKISPANLVQIVVLHRAQPINIRGYMSRAY